MGTKSTSCQAFMLKSYIHLAIPVHGCETRSCVGGTSAGSSSEDFITTIRKQGSGIATAPNEAFQSKGMQEPKSCRCVPMPHGSVAGSQQGVLWFVISLMTFCLSQMACAGCHR